MFGGMAVHAAQLCTVLTVHIPGMWLIPGLLGWFLLWDRVDCCCSCVASS